MLEHGRKIATILAADVVEYSRLMGVDETGTVAALKVRRALFEQLVRDFEGSEFGSVGDSLMAQFPSAVNAVQCAQAIQRAIAKENEPLAPDQRMSLRIGVNLGDVIEEDGALFGDGVNVAARLQSLAAPGGILIAGAVYEQVKKKLPTRFNYTGVRQVKNISDPVATYEVLEADERHPLLKGFVRYARRHRVGAIAVLALLAAGVLWWIWRGDITATQLQSMLQPAVPPSVAVLPFVNMSSEPDNEPFADGLSEEVLNVLAGIEGLKVAGRTSSFYYKGKNEKLSVIAATLSVNHLLEGSVRWAGPKVRITAQLIDATTGFHLWSETFDRETTDIFAVQEEIARSVAGALQVTLLPADEAHLAKRSTQNPDAHRLYLVARGRMRERGLANLRAAKALFEEAIQRDPLYANAYSGLADAYYLLIYNHAQELELGERLGAQAANRAIELDPTSSEAHASRANFALWRYDDHGDVQQLERAIADYQRAIELDPSNAEAHHWYGDAVEESGDPDRALRLYERAVELDPLMRQAQLAAARVIASRGEYDKARRQITQVIDRYPDFADAYNLAGFVEWQNGHLVEARSWFKKAYELEPDPTTALVVYQTSAQLGDRVTAAEWLPRIAGVPYLERYVEAEQLSTEGKYPQALEAVMHLEFDENWAIHAVWAAHLALLAGHPERATAILLKEYPELAKDESPITQFNCGAAIALAASWQRTNQRPEADRLLRRTAVFLDSPRAPRVLLAGEAGAYAVGDARAYSRAQVHALLGERDQAFSALDRAFNEGRRGVNSIWCYRGEDDPLFDSIRSDPRFKAWFARLHADNARQLAQLK
jgi:adenylate cyclase